MRRNMQKLLNSLDNHKVLKRIRKNFLKPIQSCAIITIKQLAKLNITYQPVIIDYFIVLVPIFLNLLLD